VRLGKEVNVIDVGGMPNGIIKFNCKLYIGDYLRGKIIIYDLNSHITKAIAVGIEPNAMALC
ncbi:MAG: YncE family protein, partial [Clostridium sp.]